MRVAANGRVVTVTWTSEAGKKAPPGYCDVTDYSTRLIKNVHGHQITSAAGALITTGSWSTSNVNPGEYTIQLNAYSEECDDWSPNAAAWVTVR